jgi:Flp pilus assembly pilin Flp
MHVLTTPSPHDQTRETETDQPGRATEPIAWHWVPDQRSARATGLALAHHVRPRPEPIQLARQVPRIQLDATPRPRSEDDEAGQATAEYALVLLGAAAIALLVVSWATKTNVVGKLLDVIFSQLVGRATGR